MSAQFAEEENDDLEFTSGEASSSDDANSTPKESSSEKLKDNFLLFSYHLCLNKSFLRKIAQN